MPASAIATVVWSVLFCVGVAVAAPDAPPADAPNRASSVAVEKGGDLSAVFGRVARAASAGDWQRAGWDDPAITAAVADLVERIGRAAEIPAPALPVKIGDVPAAAGDRHRGLTGALWVGTDLKVSRAQGSVILADGSVDISLADNCLIVARGAVEISHGAANVVIAGHFIHVSHDGNMGRPRGNGGGGGASVLVSGGVIDVSHATGTVFSAPQLVRVSHSNGARFVNSPNVDAGHEQNCKRVNDPNVPALPAAGKNPLEGKVKVTQVVDGDDERRRFVTVERGGVETVVRPGAEVRDAAGAPVAELAGWKLSFVSEDYALFNKDGEYAGFLVPARR